MGETLVAKASATIGAPRAKVWDALVNPEAIQKYMFGTHVVSDWREGSPIVWKGEWQGKHYEDKGTVLRIEPQRLLQFTHFSPLSGLADTPENYHRVTIEVSDEGPGTRVALAQDNNLTEEARAHSEKNWETVLDGLKQLLEK
jgi:uncharacterized protein YndB with AHSA1/START domain